VSLIPNSKSLAASSDRSAADIDKRGVPAPDDQKPGGGAHRCWPGALSCSGVSPGARQSDACRCFAVSPVRSDSTKADPGLRIPSFSAPSTIEFAAFSVRSTARRNRRSSSAPPRGRVAGGRAASDKTGQPQGMTGQPALPRLCRRQSCQQNAEAGVAEEAEAALYGVEITGLYKGTAAKEGMEVGDIILNFNGTPTPTFEALADAVARSGSQAQVLVIRGDGGERETITLFPQDGRIGLSGEPVRVNE
jgi:hypothetical protein